VVLADFGRSSFPGEDSQLPGTLCYAAPEALEGRGSRSSDCWSAGLVAYACLELQLPFGEELEGDKAAAAAVLSLGEKQRSWPSWASWLISGLLQVEPKKRLSARQGVQHLEKVEDPLAC
jgi:serine/threonine protein kinase